MTFFGAQYLGLFASFARHVVFEGLGNCIFKKTVQE